MTRATATLPVEELRRRTPDLRGLGEIRLVRLENGPGRGQRLLLARNAAGLAFEVAVDRAFDLCSLTYRGINLGWNSPVHCHAPSFAHDLEAGMGLLRHFDGLIVTCGLDHYGEPATGSAAHFEYPLRRTVHYPLHGRVSCQAATLIGYGLGQAPDPMLWCEAEVRQATVFGEVLVLRRRIELQLFGRQIKQYDVVMNQGYRPTRHALLYHVNIGYPFLDQDAELVGGFGELRERFRALPPVPADDLQEVDDHIADPESDRYGRVTVGIRNPSLLGGISLRIVFNRAQLPQLHLWRCWQSGLYVMGIEPCTGLTPDSFEYRGEDTPHFLECGASRRYELTLDISEG